MTATLIAVAVTAPFAFILWALLHEVAHLTAVRMFRNVSWYRIVPAPHWNDAGAFQWASVEWTHTGEPLTPGEAAVVKLAPRAPDLLAALLTPVVAAYVETWVGAIPLVLIGAGLVDLLIGSLGISPASDLRVASEALQWPPMKLRVLGAMILLFSVVATVYNLATP